jgi:hypothetical protein
MGRPTGIHPYAVFAPEKLTYVGYIKIRFSLENRKQFAPMWIFWKTKEGSERFLRRRTYRCRSRTDGTKRDGEVPDP